METTELMTRWILVRSPIERVEAKEKTKMARVGSVVDPATVVVQTSTEPKIARIGKVCATYVIELDTSVPCARVVAKAKTLQAKARAKVKEKMVQRAIKALTTHPRQRVKANSELATFVATVPTTLTNVRIGGNLLVRWMLEQFLNKLIMG